MNTNEITVELQHIQNNDAHQHQAKKHLHKNTNTLQPGSCIAALANIFIFKSLLRGLFVTYELKYLYQVEKKFELETSFPRFLQYFQKIKAKKPRASLLRIIMTYKLCYTLLYFILFTIISLLQFVGPLLLPYILSYVKYSEDDPQYKGVDAKKAYLYSTGILLAYLLKAYFNSITVRLLDDLAVVACNNLKGLIYDKISKLSCAGLSYLSAGKLSYIITVNVPQIEAMFKVLPQLVVCPVSMIIAFVILFVKLGWLGIFPIIFSFITVTVQLLTSFGMNKKLKTRFRLGGKRSQALTEIIRHIRLVKMFGGENAVTNWVLLKIRKNEIALIYRLIYARGFQEVLINVLPYCCLLCIFSVYSSKYDDFGPTVVYSTISVMTIIGIPTRLLTVIIKVVVASRAALSEIETYLNFEEKKIYENNNNLSLGSIEIQDGKFQYESETSRKNLSLLESPIKKRKSKKQDFDNASAHRDPLKSILQKINLQIQSGCHYAVVGLMGSGKSSLLHSLAGELVQTSGTYCKNGSIAIVSEVPFLMNDTIKNNILFGLEYDASKFETIIKICDLDKDLEHFEGGDETEIGEHGDNLSGGQKQKISLARALYSNADIYLIDDIFADLDLKAANHIFNSVMCSYLNGKTMLLATTSLNLITKIENIIILKDGFIIDQGTCNHIKTASKNFNELFGETISNSHDANKIDLKINTENYIKTPTSPPPLATNEEIQKKKNDDNAILENHIEFYIPDADLGMGTFDNTLSFRRSTSEKKLSHHWYSNKQKGVLVEEEQKFSGRIKFSVYWFYFKNGGCIFILISVLLFAISVANLKIIEWWCGYWSQYSIEKWENEEKNYILVLFGLIMLAIIIIFLRQLFFAKFATRASGRIFALEFNNILKKSLEWFDGTPVGRILNRLVRDQDDADIQLPFNLVTNIYLLFFSVMSFILISIITPYFAIPISVFLILFLFILKLYLKSSLEIKRTRSLSQSLLLSTMTEYVQGAIICRGFGKQNYLQHKFYTCNNQYAKAYLHEVYLKNSIIFFIDTLLALMVGAACYFGVLSKLHNWIKQPALIGYTISSSFAAATAFQYTVYGLSDLINYFTSIQRIQFYATDKTKFEENTTSPEPPALWPSEGKIVLKNVWCKYKKNLPYILKELNLTIEHKEKIGIIGPSGSGKSTLLLALLRILEIDSQDNNIDSDKRGSILISGADISKIGSYFIRKKLAVVPQEPALFGFTLRYNMDPFNEFSDDEIIKSLEDVEMLDKIIEKETMPEIQEDTNRMKSETEKLMQNKRFILNEKIQNEGANYSVGERQLLCIARAIIRKPKILLMDEATSNIDEKTDNLIHKMIKNKFSDSTILTITHRLHSIIHYNKIIGLEDGKIVEMDTPANLFKNHNSLFYKLAKRNGPNYVEFLGKLLESHD